MTFLCQCKSSELLRVTTVALVAKYTNCNSAITVTNEKALIEYKSLPRTKI